jgi:PPOX class probable F420-dependent enzyme
MTATMNEKERALFEEPNFVHLATLDEDGHPHVTPVWVDLEGDMIVINTAEGRHKVEHMRRDDRVGLSVHQQSNPYNNVSVRGRVTEITAEGADAHIDALAKKYMGEDTYPFRSPDEVRLIVRIRPEDLTSLFMG